MKTISLTVSPEDYEAFRQAARARHCSIAQLIRDAMAFYRAEKLPHTTPLTELPILPGHRPCGALPSRVEIYTEIFADAKGPRP
jgi:Ribbon-helix-helix protein, copG family